MSAGLAAIRSPEAIQAALDEFEQLGRNAFLERYDFGKSKTYFVRNPKTGNLCDSKAIAGVARKYQLPGTPPMRREDFSGGDATVAALLQRLGFEVVKLGEDWSEEEVRATVTAYFRMLRHEAMAESYNKSEFNADLRSALRERSKAAVELKHQNISAVLQDIRLPFIDGYKPRGNAQLLLRKTVQRYLTEHATEVEAIVDALESGRPPAERPYTARVVEPPVLEQVAQENAKGPRVRVPRKVDYAARDEKNRDLGRAGEHWCIGYEHHRLSDAGMPELVQRIDWVADRIGDGTGYDIQSFTAPDRPRYIEVKTTNSGLRTSFIVSQNELDVSRELGDAFYLYRVFNFRQETALYLLQGDISRWVSLEAMDYRASFRQALKA